MNAPLLSVCLITYNQAPYIRQAVDSILMQKTGFTWDIIIADDCSDDGTREIIKEYAAQHPENIRLILQEKNIGAARNWSELMRSSDAEYLAYLEGDDYWTDTDKLAREVGFLKEHSDYSLVCTDYNVMSQETGKVTENFLGTRYGLTREHDIIFSDYMFSRRAIRSLTVVMKRAALDAYFREMSSEIVHNPAAGDLPLWLFILSRSRVRYIPQSTAVYRVLPGTGSRPEDPQKKRVFQEGVCDILEYYIRSNDLPPSFNKKLGVQRMLINMEYGMSIGDKSLVMKTFRSLLCRGVISRRAIKMAVSSILKREKGEGL